MLSISQNTTVVERDIHCPYCQENSAMLINKTVGKKLSFQLPAYGKKYVLSLLYLSFPYMWIHGYKTLEINKDINTVTYGFCPKCGNSFSMDAPTKVVEKVEEPPLYCIKKGKVFMGLCQGIAEYINVPATWVRVMTLLYGLVTFVGIILYFIIGAIIPAKEDVEGRSNEK